MPKSVRTKKQARAERRALKILRNAGLLTSAIDLRRRPTKYQRSLIKRFADVISGKAAAVKTKAAKYRGIKSFFVKGDVVVVPKRKGETIAVDKKTGKITRKRRVGGRTIKGIIHPRKRVDELPRPKLKATVFRVPFLKKKKGGKHDIQWRRFTYDAFKLFAEKYRDNAKDKDSFDEWMNFVEEETATDIDETWIKDHEKYAIGWINNGATYKKKKRRNRLWKALKGESDVDEE